jgi:hypothetical protein
MEGEGMKVRLTLSWELSGEHSTGSDGKPVLIHRSSGKIFGPEDAIEFYPNWGIKPAAVHVGRMSMMRKFSEEELNFIELFKMPDEENELKFWVCSKVT